MHEVVIDFILDRKPSISIPISFPLIFIFLPNFAPSLFLRFFVIFLHLSPSFFFDPLPFHPHPFVPISLRSSLYFLPNLSRTQLANQNPNQSLGHLGIHGFASQASMEKMRGAKHSRVCVWNLGFESCEEQVDGRAKRGGTKQGGVGLCSPTNFRGSR
ncbi:hypothetical protein DVH24_033813 [Malus domestica]|uniref:Uncharacterized protein n=1 Tax=Malus domestica TaxID=3750 RepID=A0A498HRL9_MALDO|nr:hypothetical protein DVH24_033813 [Malus domestica]